MNTFLIGMLSTSREMTCSGDMEPAAAIPYLPDDGGRAMLRGDFCQTLLSYCFPKKSDRIRNHPDPINMANSP